MISLRFLVLCIVVVALAELFLVTGHGPHVVGYLPFVILFACPVMHIFMQGRHQRQCADSAQR